MAVTYSFDHAHLNAVDVEAAASFYERVFDARRIRTFEANGVTFAQLEMGGVRLTITSRPYAHSGRGNAVDHFALSVPDLDEAIADLRAKGVEFRAGERGRSTSATGRARRAASGMPSSTRPTTWPSRFYRWKRRHDAAHVRRSRDGWRPATLAASHRPRVVIPLHKYRWRAKGAGRLGARASCPQGPGGQDARAPRTSVRQLHVVRDHGRHGPYRSAAVSSNRPYSSRGAPSSGRA